ncbi:MAG: tetratricopeptide repeat protein [Gemmataceae bacterium]
MKAIRNSKAQSFVLALALGAAGATIYQSAQIFAQSQVPGASPVAGEIGAVKRVITARREYQASLEQLRGQYVSTNDTEKLRWVEDEVKQFHRVPKHAYVLDLDVPGPGLRAEQNVPQANELYRRAMEYKDKGFGNEFLDNQIRAELLFQQLISQYPTSNKNADAAYQLGDIYESRAFHQYRRAAVYFERSFQWNPNTHLDGRVRAARLYDKALNDRPRATELYKAVLAYETDPVRIKEAQRRLGELKEIAP